MSDLAYVVAPGAEVRVDETGNTGLSPSIALDSRGHPHVAYYDRDAGQMQYAVEDGGWAVETIDSGANWVSLALDDADAAHVVYQRDAQAWYAQNVDGDWRLQTIEEAAGTGDSTAVAVHDGIVHALYGASGLDRVRYATRPLPDGVDSDCDGVQ
jgi:hypothetical protein